MSMQSMPGEEEGTGGVVPSRSIGGVFKWSFLGVSFTILTGLDRRIDTYTFRSLTE
jgi:hypothetical protein